MARGRSKIAHPVVESDHEDENYGDVEMEDVGEDERNTDPTSDVPEDPFAFTDAEPFNPKAASAVRRRKGRKSNNDSEYETDHEEQEESEPAPKPKRGRKSKADKGGDEDAPKKTRKPRVCKDASAEDGAERGVKVARKSVPKIRRPDNFPRCKSTVAKTGKNCPRFAVTETDDFCIFHKRQHDKQVLYASSTPCIHEVTSKQQKKPCGRPSEPGTSKCRMHLRCTFEVPDKGPCQKRVHDKSTTRCIHHDLENKCRVKACLKPRDAESQQLFCYYHFHHLEKKDACTHPSGCKELALPDSENKLCKKHHQVSKFDRCSAMICQRAAGKVTRCTEFVSAEKESFCIKHCKAFMVFGKKFKPQDKPAQKALERVATVGHAVSHLLKQKGTEPVEIKLKPAEVQYGIQLMLESRVIQVKQLEDNKVLDKVIYQDRSQSVEGAAALPAMDFELPADGQAVRVQPPGDARLPTTQQEPADDDDAGNMSEDIPLQTLVLPPRVPLASRLGVPPAVLPAHTTTAAPTSAAATATTRPQPPSRVGKRTLEQTTAAALAKRGKVSTPMPDRVPSSQTEEDSGDSDAADEEMSDEVLTSGQVGPAGNDFFAKTAAEVAANVYKSFIVRIQLSAAETARSGAQYRQIIMKQVVPADKKFIQVQDKLQSKDYKRMAVDQVTDKYFLKAGESIELNSSRGH